MQIGSLSTDGQKGWLGVKMESVDLPLALSLGRLNANGALIIEATAGGPAGQAGLRFGDIIISLQRQDRPQHGGPAPAGFGDEPGNTP